MSRQRTSKELSLPLKAAVVHTGKEAAEAPVVELAGVGDLVDGEKPKPVGVADEVERAGAADREALSQ